MAMKFKKGENVRQVVRVIEGSISGVAIVDDEVQYCVEFLDADGEMHSRYFKEDQLEAKPAEVPVDPA